MSFVHKYRQNYIKDFFKFDFNGGQSVVVFDNLEINEEWEFIEGNYPKIYKSANGFASAIPRIQPTGARFSVRLHHPTTHARVRELIFRTRSRYKLNVEIDPIIVSFIFGGVATDYIKYKGKITAVLEFDKNIAALVNGKGKGLRKDDVIPMTIYISKELTVPTDPVLTDPNQQGNTGTGTTESVVIRDGEVIILDTSQQSDSVLDSDICVTDSDAAIIPGI